MKKNRIGGNRNRKKSFNKKWRRIEVMDYSIWKIDDYDEAIATAVRPKTNEIIIINKWKDEKKYNWWQPKKNNAI